MKNDKEKFKNNQKNKREIIYAFIDSQNLNLGIRDSGWILDFEKFYIHLKHKYKINKAYIFIGYVAGNENLYTNLQKIGYILIFKPTLEYNKKEEKLTKGNVDAELVLHCMLEYNNFNKCIIVSGDGDFHCLLEQLKKDNKLYKLGIPNKKRYSALLRKFSNHHFYASQLKDKLEHKKRHLNRNASLSVAFYRDILIL